MAFLLPISNYASDILRCPTFGGDSLAVNVSRPPTHSCSKRRTSFLGPTAQRFQWHALRPCFRNSFSSCSPLLVFARVVPAELEPLTRVGLLRMVSRDGVTYHVIGAQSLRKVSRDKNMDARDLILAVKPDAVVLDQSGTELHMLGFMGSLDHAAEKTERKDIRADLEKAFRKFGINNDQVIQDASPVPEVSNRGDIGGAVAAALSCGSVVVAGAVEGGRTKIGLRKAQLESMFLPLAQLVLLFLVKESGAKYIIQLPGVGELAKKAWPIVWWVGLLFVINRGLKSFMEARDIDVNEALSGGGGRMPTLADRYIVWAARNHPRLPKKLSDVVIVVNKHQVESVSNLLAGEAGGEAESNVEEEADANSDLQRQQQDRELKAYALLMDIASKGR
mmetsp:Transcript_31008/g.50163  ORF Transcript_31008/g.50163 Transcript_31008/m.50163 type:complete len:392 (+) Transcript_31008:65-1240(+)